MAPHARAPKRTRSGQVHDLELKIEHRPLRLNLRLGSVIVACIVMTGLGDLGFRPVAQDLELGDVELYQPPDRILESLDALREWLIGAGAPTATAAFSNLARLSRTTCASALASLARAVCSSLVFDDLRTRSPSVSR
jgi:hypothetical protein